MIRFFFRRRTVYVPTVFGSVLLGALLAVPLIYWFVCGESFLSLTERVPAKVLVVEGWIGLEGLRAAKLEFEKGGYDLLITSGGAVSPYSEEGRWAEGWTYAEGAYHQLQRLGLSAEKIISAPPTKVIEARRTYESALAVKAVLVKLGIEPKAINVFSFGPHSRRSYLVYERVFASPGGIRVGIIAWEPPRYAAGPWWKSSERSIEMLVQSVGYFYEVFFNSGRRV